MPHSMASEDMPSYIVSNLKRLAGKEPDEGASAMYEALAHIAEVSEKTGQDVSKLERRVSHLESKHAEFDDLRRVNLRQDDELKELRVRLDSHENRVRGGWWVACLIAGCATTIIGALWMIFDKFAK